MIEADLPFVLVDPQFSRLDRRRFLVECPELFPLLVDKRAGRAFRFIPPRPRPGPRARFEREGWFALAPAAPARPILWLPPRLFLDPERFGRLVLMRSASPDDSSAWSDLMAVEDLVGDMDDHTDFMSYVRGHMALTGDDLKWAVGTLERALGAGEAVVRRRAAETVRDLAAHIDFHGCLRRRDVLTYRTLCSALRRARDRERDGVTARQIEEAADAIDKLPPPRPDWD